MEFDPTPYCQSCSGDVGYPVGWTEHSGIEFHCSMCSFEESITYIEPSEVPTETLKTFFVYAQRVDASLERLGKDPRFEQLRSVYQEEFDKRGVEVEGQSFTRRAETTKDKADDIEEVCPGFMAVGHTPDDFEYRNGLTSADIEWECLVSEAEAERLDSMDGVTVSVH